jgi:hypothetical protein
MKDRSMFPYRRGNKKRGKGGPQGRNQRDGGGRRTPGSVHEILSLLQPTTKALAQMLAGNTRASGQLVHARNILAQAERLVEERQADRLFPAQREEFLEQLARLKLTLADADSAVAEAEEREVERAARPATVLAPERLREMVLSLASSPVAERTPGAAEPEEPETAPEVPPLRNGAARPAAAAGPEPREEEPQESAASRNLPPGSPRKARLRLKSERRDEGEDAGRGADGTRKVPAG